MLVHCAGQLTTPNLPPDADPLRCASQEPYCSTSDRSAILGDIEQAKAAGMAVDEQCLRRRPEADTDRHLAVTGAYL